MRVLVDPILEAVGEVPVLEEKLGHLCSQRVR
jgi:hypothetical protein